MRFWNWNNANGSSAELTIYGDIESEKWWDSDVTLTDFYKAMKAAEPFESLTVRIKSNGGDVGTGLGIYNLIKSQSAKTTVIIDGYAASIATVIAMAGDEVKIPKCGIFMIHDPKMVPRGAKSAKEMRKGADTLDKIKEAITAAYAEKTGMANEEIERMMEDETYMTGEEAVEYGFCDSICEADTTVEVSNKGDVFVNSSKVGKIPMKNKGKEKNKERNDQEMEIKNKDELRAKYKDLCEEIAAEAAKEERERIKEIEDAAIPGYEKEAYAAMFEKTMSAGEYALEVMKKQKKEGEDYDNKREKELSGSGAKDVGGRDGAEDDGGEKKNKFLEAADKIFGSSRLA